MSRPNTTATPELREAAAIARDAAYFLAEQDPHSREGRRYRIAADRLSAALASPRISRLRLLLASPAVLEQSGRTRSLIEMIDAEPADSENRLRTAKLLIRALVWRPETFPYPAE